MGYKYYLSSLLSLRLFSKSLLKTFLLHFFSFRTHALCCHRWMSNINIINYIEKISQKYIIQQWFLDRNLPKNFAIRISLLIIIIIIIIISMNTNQNVCVYKTVASLCSKQKALDCIKILLKFALIIRENAVKLMRYFYKFLCWKLI